MAAPVNDTKIKADLASSRDSITACISALRRDLDFGAKLKRGVRKYPLAWYAAAGVLGLLLSKIPPLRRKVVVNEPKRRRDATQETGKVAIGVTILKYVFDFAKPALLRWFKERFLVARRPARDAKL